MAREATRFVRSPAPRRFSRRDRSIAYHEAGHFVAACGAGFQERVARATIRREGDIGGCVEVWGVPVGSDVRAFLGGRAWRTRRGDPLVGEAVAGVFFRLGGDAAESVLTGVPRIPSPYFEIVFDPRASTEIREALDVLAALLGRPPPRSARGLVAVLRGEFERVRAWLLPHWVHVAAVAEALLFEGELSPARLRRILASCPPLVPGALLLPAPWFTGRDLRRHRNRRPRSRRGRRGGAAEPRRDGRRRDGGRRGRLWRA